MGVNTTTYAKQEATLWTRVELPVKQRGVRTLGINSAKTRHWRLTQILLNRKYYDWIQNSLHKTILNINQESMCARLHLASKYSFIVLAQE